MLLVAYTRVQTAVLIQIEAYLFRQRSRLHLEVNHFDLALN